MHHNVNIRLVIRMLSSGLLVLLSISVMLSMYLTINTHSYSSCDQGFNMQIVKYQSAQIVVQNIYQLSNREYSLCHR